MTKTKILILGGSGFIGTNLLKFYLKTDYEIHTTINITSLKIDDQRIHKHYGDLTNKGFVYRVIKDMDIVIHTAAINHGSTDAIKKPEVHVTDNAIINSLVLRACHDLNVKHCIFLSCTVMYKSSETPQSEEDWDIRDKLIPPYFGVGWTKIYTEKMCTFYSGLGQCKYTAIRHSNVFGPYDKFDLTKCHVLPALIKKIDQGNRPWHLEIWGDGKAKRDLLYIDDLMDCIDRCLEHQEEQYELFNCGCGKAYNVVDLAKMIMKIMGKDLDIEFNKDKPNISTTVAINSDRAKNILGWTPQTKLEDGLTKTIRWYQEQ